MTHPVNAQAENAGHPTSTSLVSDVAAQMQRIEQARQRIQASSHAISIGALATTLSEQTGPSSFNDPSQQRLDGMGRAMDHVLQRMQKQALADIDSVMQQHAALRKFQQNMACEQQQAPCNNGAHGHASESRTDDVIDVEAKPVPEPSTTGSSVQPPHQH